MLGGGRLTLFTLSIAALTAGALVAARRCGMSTPRSRFLLLPAGALAGLAVALVAARGLIVLGLAFGLVTGACCLVLHLLLFPAPRRTG